MIFRGNDQEIEFQEIEIGIFQEIESFAKLIRRSKRPKGPLGGKLG